MPIDVIFLEEKTSLADQVARVLLRDSSTLPIDLGTTQVWVPTLGASRRIRAALARQAPVLSPVFLQPMEALLPKNPPLPLASRIERELAWARILQTADESERHGLIPDVSHLHTPAAWLGLGSQLVDLGDLLIQGGHDMSDPILQTVCGEEDGLRWEQLGQLNRRFQRFLENAGRLDSNAARCATLRDSAAPNIAGRIVVACVSDLAVGAAIYLEKLAACGWPVEILIWKPGNLAAGWDEFGRPLASEWADAEIALARSQIALSRLVEDEADRALAFLEAGTQPGDYAITLADETLAAPFSAAIEQRGGQSFAPVGHRLSQSEAAGVALEWAKFQKNDELRSLRTLLQKPGFLGWMRRRSGLQASELLEAVDYMITHPLAETVAEAESFLASPELPRLRELTLPARNSAQILTKALEPLRNLTPAEVLRETWEGTRDPAQQAEVALVLQLQNELLASPLLQDWPEALEAALTRNLAAAETFEKAPEGAVELSGWLEAPWLEAARLAICGCSEGRIPASVTEHAFLPNAKRQALGLADNASRFARDASLLSCLLLRHGANLQVSFAKFGSDGSPALPSRLLLQTKHVDLPARVLQVFGESSARPSEQPARRNGWLWKLPDHYRKTDFPKISATQFKDYLECPFRFYWKHVLKVDAYEPDPREMDPRIFGTVVHSVLETFGKEAAKERDERRIATFTLDILEREARRYFGDFRAPTVRVQLESIKVRLRAFARVQAAARADGWEIIGVERKFPGEGEDAVRVGNLPLSAQIDRIEQHPERGLRIMDYKTFAKAPTETHFGKQIPDHFLPEAQVSYAGKARSWAELQLPLYHLLASRAYPGTPIQMAYFILPSDPDRTAIAEFPLSEAEQASASRCATEIALRVEKGIFWPPRMPKYDSFAMLFLNGSPEKCIDPETIEFLKGRP